MPSALCPRHCALGTGSQPVAASNPNTLVIAGDDGTKDRSVDKTGLTILFGAAAHPTAAQLSTRVYTRTPAAKRLSKQFPSPRFCIPHTQQTEKKRVSNIWVRRITVRSSQVHPFPTLQDRQVSQPSVSICVSAFNNTAPLPATVPHRQSTRSVRVCARTPIARGATKYPAPHRRAEKAPLVPGPRGAVTGTC